MVATIKFVAIKIVAVGKVVDAGNVADAGKRIESMRDKVNAAGSCTGEGGCE